MAEQPSIIVASRSEADALSARGLFDAIIAIVGCEDRPCTGFDDAPHRLRLDFDDLVAVAANPAKTGAALPTVAHVQQLCAFAEDLAGRNVRVLCHCTAGRSRSPAAAIACLAVWHGPGREDDAASTLFALRPLAFPNRMIIHLADNVLSRRGRLIAAVERAQPRRD